MVGDGNPDASRADVVAAQRPPWPFATRRKTRFMRRSRDSFAAAAYISDARQFCFCHYARFLRLGPGTAGAFALAATPGPTLCLRPGLVTHALQRRLFRIRSPSMPEAMSCWAASSWRGFTALRAGSGRHRTSPADIASPRPLSLHRRRLRVLDLDPMRGAAGAVGRA